jgi:hypothetical protein
VSLIIYNLSLWITQHIWAAVILWVYITKPNIYKLHNEVLSVANKVICILLTVCVCVCGHTAPYESDLNRNKRRIYVGLVVFV